MPLTWQGTSLRFLLDSVFEFHLSIETVTNLFLSDPNEKTLAQVGQGPLLQGKTRTGSNTSEAGRQEDLPDPFGS